MGSQLVDFCSIQFGHFASSLQTDMTLHPLPSDVKVRDFADSPASVCRPDNRRGSVQCLDHEACIGKSAPLLRDDVTLTQFPPFGVFEGWLPDAEEYEDARFFPSTDKDDTYAEQLALSDADEDEYATHPDADSDLPLRRFDRNSTAVNYRRILLSPESDDDGDDDDDYKSDISDYDSDGNELFRLALPIAGTIAQRRARAQGEDIKCIWRQQIFQLRYDTRRRMGLVMEPEELFRPVVWGSESTPAQSEEVSLGDMQLDPVDLPADIGNVDREWDLLTDGLHSVRERPGQVLLGQSEQHSEELDGFVPGLGWEALAGEDDMWRPISESPGPSSPPPARDLWDGMVEYIRDIPDY